MLTLFKTLDSIIHGSCTSNDRIVNTLYYYQRALKKYPRDVKLLFATGHVYCKLGRYEMALEYLNKCIAIRKKQPEPEPAWPITLGWLYFLKGHVLRIMDRFVDAEYYLKKALPKEQNHEDEILFLFVKINQGYIQKRLGKYGESLKSFEKCEEFLEKKKYSCPNKEIQQNNWQPCEKCQMPIYCYNALKEYIIYYKTINTWEDHNLDPSSDVDLNTLLGNLEECMHLHTCYSPEKNKYVIELKQKILAASGTQTDPFGDISRDIQSGYACELNDNITKQESDDILHKSEIFRLLGITVAAKDFLLKLVHTPFSHYANFYIGCILRQESKCTEAHEYFRKCLQTKPGDLNIQYNIAETYRRNGRYKEALILYDVCLNKNQADREVWLKKASVLSELCEYSKALQYYEKYETEIEEQFKDLLKDYIKLHPVYDEFFTRNKAYVAYGQGKYIEALKYADASLKCNLNNEYAIITKVRSIIGICERIRQSGKEVSTTPLLNEEYRLYPLENQKGNWYAIVHQENTIRHLYKYDIPGNVTCQFETLKSESYQKVRKYLLKTYTNSPDDLINKYYAAVRIDSAEIASPSDSIKNKLADLYKQCLQDIKKALARNRKNPDLYLLQGVLSLKSGDIKESIASITEYFRKCKNTVEDLERIRQNIPEQSREAALFLLFCHQRSQAKKDNVGVFQTDLNEEIIKYLFKSDYKDKVEFQDTDIISLMNFIAREEKFSECESPLMDMLDYNPFFKDITLNIKKGEETIYKQIFLQALKIISLLYVNVDCEKRVAHYTRMDVAHSLLAANPASPLRLNSIVRTNDPLEGLALLEYLDINGPNRKKDYQSFIGCFVFDYDNLNHFRLYGKNDHQEATGASLVVNKVFFREIQSLLSHTNSYKYRLDIPQKLPLIRCIYIDPASKQFISVGHRRKNSFFRTENELKTVHHKEIKMIREYLTKNGTDPENIKTFVTGKLLNDTIDEIANHMEINVKTCISQDAKLVLLKNQKLPEIHAGLEELIKNTNTGLAEMSIEKIMPVIEKIICKREELVSVIRYNIYDQYIEEIIKEVQRELKSLQKMILDNKNHLDEEILCQLLLPLRFLIKHASFKEEKECRIYRIINLRTEKQLISREGYMFIEYGNLQDSVYKVIFGAKALGHKIFQDHLIMKGLENILCERSKHQLN